MNWKRTGGYGGKAIRKYAVLLYPNFSLQEITCLTSALTVWFGEKIDYIASEDKEYRSEEGFRILPTKTTAEAKITDYDCVILPGTIYPLPALFDDVLIDFLRSGFGRVFCSDFFFSDFAVESGNLKWQEVYFRLFHADGGRF